jgi:hypothetical protein
MVLITSDGRDVPGEAAPRTPEREAPETEVRRARLLLGAAEDSDIERVRTMSLWRQC